jgi:hypothetical protein
MRHAATWGLEMSITIQQILEVLRAAPEGLTAKEVSAKLGAASYDAGGRLSKLTAYGEIEKIRTPSPSGKSRWRLKQLRSDHQYPADTACSR